MHVWVDQSQAKGEDRRGMDLADTWQHFTFIVAAEDARSEAEACIRKCLSWPKAKAEVLLKAKI